MLAGLRQPHRTPSARNPYRRWPAALIALLLLAVGCRALPSISSAAELASRIIILANRDDPGSLRIARHYAAARGVPAENLIALPLPATEAMEWRGFIDLLWQPLLDELVRRGWIDAVPMAAMDAIGRRKFAPNGHRIAALVVCRGVPLKISHNAEYYADSPPFTRRVEFRTNAGAIDAELSLLALPNYSINAFVPNPLFHNERPSSFELAQVVKVSRLDGPAVEDALALVDRALAAEQTGLLGRAYVDLSDRDPVGNEWLEGVMRQLTDLGFQPAVDYAPATWAAGARFDAPVLYFGWYAADLNGPFALPGFRFPPGAIALHIHSYSAATLRDPGEGWTGPLVARGVTATVGNVHEPYLQFTHRPNLLLRALARGETWVDAAYYSLQALSWQGVVIGDPLYRPFALSRAEQWRNRARLPSRLAGYAVLQQMFAMETAGRSQEALELARAGMSHQPNLALGLALAERLAEAGDGETAASALGFARYLNRLPADEWALAREAAQLLRRCGHDDWAVAVWRSLLGHERMPSDLRRAWLLDATEAARAAGDRTQAEAWQREIQQLDVSPRPP